MDLKERRERKQMQKEEKKKDEREMKGEGRTCRETPVLIERE